ASPPPSRHDALPIFLDVATGERRPAGPVGDRGAWAVAFSPNGKVLAAGPLTGPAHILLWDAATGKERAQLEGHDGAVCSLAFSRSAQHPSQPQSLTH